MGQIWFDTGASRVKIYNGTTFIALPIEISGANQGAISGGAGIIDLDLRVFASGIVDEDLGTGVSNNETLATAQAIVAEIARQITADITSHNTNTGSHSNLVSTNIDTPDIDGGTIDNTVIGGDTAAAGSFTAVSTSGDVTVGGVLDITDGTTNNGGTITGSLNTLTIDPDPSGIAGTLIVDGNLTVNGTTTTIASTNKTIADKDLILASNADIADTGPDYATQVNNGGIVLGTGTGREGWTYNSTDDQWETESSGVKANFFSVGSSVVIDSSGEIAATKISSGALGSDVKVNNTNWSGEDLDVANGGTGKSTVTSDVLLRGAGANDLVETTIGDGLKLAMNSLDVDPTEIGVEEFNNIPGTFGSAGNALVVDSAGTGLEYSNTLVGASTFGDWARKDGGTVSVDISDPGASDTNRVLRYNSGTYAWVDAGDLNVGLSSTADVSVASVTTSGALTVNGNTTLGDATGDDIAINGRITTGIAPKVQGTDSAGVDFGTNSQRWKSVHTASLNLNSATAVTSVATDISTVSANDDTLASAKAIRTYVDTQGGGSIVITTTGKSIAIGKIAIVTLGGVTMLWTANSDQTGVVLNTFSTVDGGTEFKETVAGFTELQTGGGAGTVTIDKFTGDGSISSYTLSINPQAEDNINVFIDGVYQAKDAYTLNSTTLQFEDTDGTDTPVPNGSKVEVLIGSVVDFTGGNLTNVTASGTIMANAFVGDGAGLTGLVTGIPNLPDVANAETKSYHLQVTDDDDSPAENDDVGSWVENSAALEITGRGCTVETGSTTDPTTLTTRAACVADLGNAGNGGTWVNGSLQLTVNGATATMTIEALLDQVSIDDLG